MNILLTNFHSMRNAGDAALLDTSLRILGEAFPDARFALSANYPHEPELVRQGLEIMPSPGAITGSFSGTSPFRQVLGLSDGLWLARRASADPSRPMPSGWQRLFQAYREAGLVVCCPGNPFFSMGRVGWPLWVSLSSLWLAHCFGRPLYILPQTLGPFRRGWETRGMRSLLLRARRVFVRDLPSQRLALSWGLGIGQVQYSPDLALDFPPASEQEARQALSRWGYSPASPALGINLVPRLVLTLSPASLEAAYQAFAAALGCFAAESGVQLFFFAQSTGPTNREDDRLPARRVLEMLPAGCRAVLVDEPFRPALLKACYGLMDAFVACRLHAGLFALGMGVPCLFVGYLEKTKGVLEMLDWLEWMIALEQITPELLARRLWSLWQQRGDLRARLQRLIPEMAAFIPQPAKIIREDLARYFQEIRT